ncbi:MBL fold metallo-hydrolase [Saccharopolyspora gloriosae]|uniref:Glyoxylase-like metal-dependent hydrolase (Beta-lactamase superfamily II) n=1 Tax=Saccharopolyspora gloriosae TaxID=455344 RepID=A0A840NDP0_9PSEU|nr:glyoxylase-like metal-dependent hydrolase (beta-lactamase superfamily II) [Saccharopolyspora gloriosae]
MLVLGFPAGPLQANCYLLAAGEGADCVIIDPGQEAAAALDEQVRDNGLNPVAVLLTHGHFDHVFSAGDVCRTYDVPAWIHPDDRYMLTDPAASMGPQGAELFAALPPLTAPAEIRDLADGEALELAGLSLSVTHSPGHTGGSVLFGVGTDEGGRLLLAGDTLFAGAIGRTDLPGGDHPTMLRTLRTRVLPLEDDTVVLPGHGPTTTIGRERASNPFLQDLVPASDEAGR